MKVSKKVLLTLGSLFMIASLGLVFAKELYVDLGNAVQHIENVKIINSGGTIDVPLKNKDGFVGVEITGNFILFGTHSGNNVGAKVRYSNILGGEGNDINSGDYNVIVAGSGNNVTGFYNMIFGGEGNKIKKGKTVTIIGGKNNMINGGDNSVIVGGINNVINGNGSSNSVIVGSGNSVTGSNSVALGLNSKVKAGNSFLWTDGNSNEELKSKNVFVVSADSGVVINTNEAHSFAKLTLGGSLFVYRTSDDNSIKCGSGHGGGIMKMVNTGNQMCLCSCDGKVRNSMFGKGKCMSVCNIDIKPRCSTGNVKRICSGASESGYYYQGACLEGNVMEGTGAYWLDNRDFLHWSCQTEDGASVECELPYSQINKTCVISPDWVAGKCDLDTPYSCLSGNVVNTGEILTGTTVYGWTWMCEGKGEAPVNAYCIRCDTGFMENALQTDCLRVCEDLGELSGKVYYYGNSNKNLPLTMEDVTNKVRENEEAASGSVAGGEKCVVLCDVNHGFFYSGATCVSGFQCKSVNWTGDEQGYIKGLGYTLKKSDTGWVYKSGIGGLSGCQYTCNTGDNYVYSGSEGCVKVSCTGGMFEGAYLITGSDEYLTGNMPKTVFDSLGAATGHKCAYLCDESNGYSFVQNVNGIPGCVKCLSGTEVYSGGVIRSCQFDAKCAEGRERMSKCEAEGKPFDPEDDDCKEAKCWYVTSCLYYGEVQEYVPELGVTGDYIYKYRRPLGQVSKNRSCVDDDENIQLYQCQYHCVTGATCLSGECFGSTCPTNWLRASSKENKSLDDAFVKMDSSNVNKYKVKSGGLVGGVWKYTDDVRQEHGAGCYFSCGNSPYVIYGTHGGVEGCLQRSCYMKNNDITQTKEWKDGGYLTGGIGTGYQTPISKFGPPENDYECYYDCKNTYEPFINPDGTTICVKMVGENGDRCPDWDYANEYGYYYAYSSNYVLMTGVATRAVNGGGKLWKYHTGNLDSVSTTGCYFNCGSDLNYVYRGGRNGCMKRSCDTPQQLVGIGGSCSGRYMLTGYGWTYFDGEKRKLWEYKEPTNVELVEGGCYYQCAPGYTGYKVKWAEIEHTNVDGKHVEPGGYNPILSGWTVCVPEGVLSGGNLRPGLTLAGVYSGCYSIYKPEAFGLSFNISGNNMVNGIGSPLNREIKIIAYQDLTGLTIKEIFPNTLGFRNVGGGMREFIQGGSLRKSDISFDSISGVWQVTTGKKLKTNETLDLVVYTKLENFPTSISGYENVVRVSAFGVTGRSMSKSFDIVLPFNVTLTVSGGAATQVDRTGGPVVWNLRVKANRDVSGFLIDYRLPNSLVYSGAKKVSGGPNIEKTGNYKWYVSGTLFSGDTLLMSVETKFTGNLSGNRTADLYVHKYAKSIKSSNTYRVEPDVHQVAILQTNPEPHFCADDGKIYIPEIDECVYPGEDFESCPAHSIAVKSGSNAVLCVVCMNTTEGKKYWDYNTHACVLGSECRNNVEGCDLNKSGKCADIEYCTDDGCKDYYNSMERTRTTPPGYTEEQCGAGS